MSKPDFTKVKMQNRVYLFPNGDEVLVRDVVSVNVSKTGTHRLNTSGGQKWIIPPKWIAINFDAEDWTF